MTPSAYRALGLLRGHWRLQNATEFGVYIYRTYHFSIAQMHHCLSIPEIVLEIVENVHRRHKDAYPNLQDLRTSKQTLVAMARTCTAFQAAALDALWKEQYGLSNLMKCLPPNKLEMKKSELVYNITIFLEEILTAILCDIRLPAVVLMQPTGHASTSMPVASDT